MAKRGTRKQMKFHSFRYQSADLFQDTLTTSNFFNYQNFNNATDVWNDFFQKIMVVTDQAVPIEGRRIKLNSQKQFGGEITVAIKNRDKLFRKFKQSRLHIHKELFKKYH